MSYYVLFIFKNHILYLTIVACVVLIYAVSYYCRYQNEIITNASWVGFYTFFIWCLYVPSPKVLYPQSLKPHNHIETMTSPQLLRYILNLFKNEYYNYNLYIKQLHVTNFQHFFFFAEYLCSRSRP